MSTPLELVITPRKRDLGGFFVRRVLPYAKRRMVGPFIFFDHIGPADFGPGEGINVRPHPHICLATVTYLFEGEIFHRDSLGHAQAIKPHAVNWMTAGRGIVHSERMRPEVRAAGQRLHGIQSWVALPREFEEVAPSFRHHPADSLPLIESDDLRLRVIAGYAYGEHSPVQTCSDTLYVDAQLGAGASLKIGSEHQERAVHVCEGSVMIASETVEAGSMAVLKEGREVVIKATDPARVMLLGGDKMDGERFIWWNFVASNEARIAKAKEDWAAGRFPKVPGDLKEFIPLPQE